MCLFRSIAAARTVSAFYTDAPSKLLGPFGSRFRTAPVRHSDGWRVDKEYSSSDSTTREMKASMHWASEWTLKWSEELWRSMSDCIPHSCQLMNCNELHSTSRDKTTNPQPVLCHVVYRLNSKSDYLWRKMYQLYTVCKLMRTTLNPECRRTRSYTVLLCVLLLRNY